MPDKLVLGVVDALSSQGINLKREDEDLDNPELHKVIKEYIIAVEAAVRGGTNLKEPRRVLELYFNVVFS